MAMTEKDFTDTGLRIEGQYENDRNADSKDLFKSILREVYGDGKEMDVIIGHHLIYEVRDKRKDGFTYEVVEEVPSADTLIFSHEVAKKLWGEENYQDVLKKLVCEPVATRDKLLASLYYARERKDH